MAFEKIVKGQHGGRETSNIVSMSCTKGGRKYLTATVIIGNAITDVLRWERKDKILAERGTGEHTGTLRLSNGFPSGFTLDRAGQRSRIAITALAAAEVRPIAPVEYETRDGALYITLPEWARGGKG